MAVSVASFGSLLAVWITALASPGPDIIQIIRVSSRSRRSGVACALGIMTGNAIWATLSLAGLGVLLNTRPPLMGVLQVFGGAYLVYLGVNAVRSGLRGSRMRLGEGTIGYSFAQAWRIGFTTNVANPKAVLFFGAVLAQFIDPGMSVGWILFIFATLVLVGVAWFCGAALAVGSLSTFLTKHAHRIDLLSGVLFILLGLFMIYSGVEKLAS